MNAHRLNHHDIQAVKSFEDRARKKARGKRIADRITLLGCALAVLALLVLAMTGGLPQ
ncbi:hypothetical protein D3C86_971080 [compost metagenome]